MEIFKEQLDTLIKQSSSRQATAEQNVAEFPTKQPQPAEATILPPLSETTTTVAWFDRGVDLDEIERQSAYRSRRKIASLDL